MSLQSTSATKKACLPQYPLWHISKIATLVTSPTLLGEPSTFLTCHGLLRSCVCSFIFFTILRWMKFSVAPLSRSVLTLTLRNLVHSCTATCIDFCLATYT